MATAVDSTALYIYANAVVGEFNTMFDEWEYEGWNIKDETPGLTTSTTTVWSPNGPMETDNGTIGF